MLCLATVSFALTLRAQAQTPPEIRHTALQCLPETQYALVDAVIVPGALSPPAVGGGAPTINSGDVQVENAKVYFRSDKYPDFYYVEMKGSEDNFQAILPKPSPETEKVIYYVEAVTAAFASARTTEHDPEVGTEDECQRQGRGSLYFTGATPRIVIGAVRAGLPAMPPGFQAAGIVGFVSAAGVASGAVGSGIGAGTAIAVGAAGAAGAVGAATALGSGGSSSSGSPSSGGSATTSSTTTTTVGATPTSSTTTSTTTTVFNEAPKACVATTPPTPVVKEGEPIRFDASCSEGDRLSADDVASYEWDLGDGRSRTGRVITVVYESAGTYTVTLTVTDAAGKKDVYRFTVTVERAVVLYAPPMACFTSTDIDPGFGCKVQFNASCSTGDIAAYDWILDKYSQMGPAVSKSGQVVIHDFGAFCDANVTAELKVTGLDGTTDLTSQLTYIGYLTNPFQQQQAIESSLSSFLGVKPFDGGTRGELVVNGAVARAVDNTSSTPLGFAGHPGVNAVEAYTTSEAEGFWRFDFGGAAHFVSGSIKVESGTVIALDDRSVVFRLKGAAGERLKLTFELMP